MKKSALIAMGCATALAACSPDKAGDEHAGHDMSGDAGEMDHSKHMAGPLSDKAVKDKAEAAALLVERFDVAACDKADLIGSLRRTSPEEGETMMRAFKTTPACAEAAIASVKGKGFVEAEPGIYTGSSAEGSDDELKIEIIGEGSSATIEWETQQQ